MPCAVFLVSRLSPTDLNSFAVIPIRQAFYLFVAKKLSCKACIMRSVGNRRLTKKRGCGVCPQEAEASLFPHRNLTFVQACTTLIPRILHSAPENEITVRNGGSFANWTSNCPKRPCLKMRCRDVIAAATSPENGSQNCGYHTLLRKTTVCADARTVGSSLLTSIRRSL